MILKKSKAYDIKKEREKKEFSLYFEDIKIICCSQ